MIPLGILAAQILASSIYRLQTLGGSDNDPGYAVTVDSAGSVYLVGRTLSAGAGSGDFLIAKFDATGIVQWQRTLGGSASEEARAVAVDSFNNAYVFGSTSSAGGGGSDFFLAKYDSSGTIQWQKALGGSGTETGRSVAVDGLASVYVFGSTSFPNPQVLLAKYNSSGVLQWQRSLGNSAFENGFGVTVDLTGNSYITGVTSSFSTGGGAILVAKYDTFGNIQWQRLLDGNSYDEGRAVKVDLSNNVYVLGQTGADFILVKYDSSGNLQWQRTLGGAGLNEARSVTVDSLGDVYVFGSTDSAGAGQKDFLLAKYNSFGTIQWQRTLGTTGIELGWSVATDSDGNVYGLGQTDSIGEGGVDFFLAVLPGDGSLTKTYVLDGVDVVYAASALTAATSTLTASVRTLFEQGSSFTDSTPTLTSAAASLVENRLDL